MNYIEINEKQRKRINQICSMNYQFDWEDKNIINILIGELPKIRHYSDETKIKKEIQHLEEYYDKYNFFRVDKNKFIQDVEALINDIKKKNEFWRGLDVFQIDRAIKLQEFCLISGEGGIGKSFFIKCLEEKISDLNIPHLCIYGKFKKDFKGFDVDEITSASKDGFIFIVDAINELSSDGQSELLNILKKFIDHPKIRVVLTYRNKAMDEKILKQYQEIAKCEYYFRGVSYESALDELQKLKIPDLYKYEDILFSNNALLLNMLLEILRNEKIEYERENSLNLVTFILETYVEKYIRKVYKNQLATINPKMIWKDVKRMANWMYQYETKEIEEKDLLSIIKNGNIFINVLEQAGIINSFEYEGKMIYSFGIDLLTDFLIARSLFDDIDQKDYDECKETIIKKTNKLYSIKEAVILIIFDKFTSDYECIKKLLFETKLITSFDYATILKIRFDVTNINDFMDVFDLTKKDDLLIYFAGYRNKPFNCVNYLNSYYKQESNQLSKLSKTLSGTHYLGRIKERLKNILYFITLNRDTDRCDDEAFYFALWCSAAPNRDIRCLAMKLLYEALQHNNEYKNLLMFLYKDIKDFYIKEAIIFVLASFRKHDKDIKDFFEHLIVNEKYLIDKSIKRIADYLGDGYKYIKYKRNDLCRKDIKCISKELINNLSYIDLMDKEFLPFRFYSLDHINMYTKFLDVDKNEIEKFNLKLSETYSCVQNGECNGSMVLEKHILSELKLDYGNRVLGNIEILSSLEVIAKKIYSLYEEPFNEKKYIGAKSEFINSTFRKCMDISASLLYGSLMCNYYTNEFITFNRKNFIGYKVYDPIEDDEDVYLTTPISTYQDYIEQLGDLILERVSLPVVKNIDWANDASYTRENLFSFLKPVVKRDKEWVLLAARISLFDKNKNNDMEWMDSYSIWCCTSADESLLEYTNCNHLTINPKYYVDNINDYKNCSSKPWLCKGVKNIYGGYEVFDETSMVLPPAELIKYFNLVPDNSNASWVNDKHEIIIYCNNNKNSYYKDSIRSTIFMRKDYFDEYIKKNTLKYFGFTERYIPKTGYANEASLHFEFTKDRIIKEFKNDIMYDKYSVKCDLCNNCPHGLKKDLSNKEIIIDDIYRFFEIEV